MDKTRTCRERVREHLAGRIDDLAKLWEAEKAGEEGVKDLGTLNEYGLSFDYVAPGTFPDQRRGYFRYQLSWGGPSDEFRFYCDENRQPIKIQYWFLDWFDGASITITEKSRAGRLIREIWDWFDSADCPETAMREAA